MPSQLQTAMQSKKFAAIGALVGAAHLSGVALKYSKSPHGIDLITLKALTKFNSFIFL